MRQDRWKRIKKWNKRMMNESYCVSRAKRGLNRGERKTIGVCSSYLTLSKLITVENYCNGHVY